MKHFYNYNTVNYLESMMKVMQGEWVTCDLKERNTIIKNVIGD